MYIPVEFQTIKNACVSINVLCMILVHVGNCWMLGFFTDLFPAVSTSVCLLHIVLNDYVSSQNNDSK